MKYSGDGQASPTTRTFAAPLVIQTQPNEQITFTIVPNVASGTFLPINGFPAPALSNGNMTAVVTADSQGFATSPQVTANGEAGSFTVTAMGTATVTFNLSVGLCAAHPSVTATTDSGAPGELRSAVNNACAGSAIDLTGLSGTITLASRLRIDDSLTINGPGAMNLTISGNNATRIFFIGNGSVSINNLTLANGLGKGGDGSDGGGGAGMGGAIFQNGGSLTVTGVTFNNDVAQGGAGATPINHAGPGGGGFGGDSSNTTKAGAGGGDLFGIGGLDGSGQGGPGAGGGGEDPSPNHGGNGGFGGGGGIGEPGGTGGFGGGGGFVSGQGGFGGGNGSGSGSSGGAGFGGAIFQYAGTLSLVNDTFTNNSAAAGGGANNGQGKGGAIFIYAGAGATASAQGVVFNGNLAVDAGQNFIGTGTDSGYSNSAGCPGVDTVDICGTLTDAGAPSKYSGDNQMGPITRTLPLPFIVQTSAGPGHAITFTIVPNSGSSGTWTPINGFPAPLINGTVATVQTDSQGFATSPQLKATTPAGPFTVTASDGLTTLTFNVTSTPCTANPTGIQATDASLRAAIASACAGSTIDLTALTGTITLASRLRIDDDMIIDGPGAAGLTISGNNATRIFFIGHGNVAINNLTLANGLGKGGNSSHAGGGAAGMGGAIFQNGGNVSVSGTVFQGNVADGGHSVACCSAPGGGFGGDGLATNGLGGPGGDLFGVPGINSGTGGPGAGGGEQETIGPGGAGGFGGGGGAGFRASGGAGGFGGGGGGGFQDTGATGGFGGGSPPAGGAGVNGGGGAGFGGAIFQYAGSLSLVNDSFTSNSALAGSGSQSGQGKGGAIFIYASAGATATADGVTFGSNTAAQAGANFIGTGTDVGYSNSAGCPGADNVNVCGTLTVLTPVLGIAKSHSGNFARGDAADTYTITVTNNGPGVTVGTLTLADTLPSGMTATAMSEMSGSDWSCTASDATCTRTTPMAVNETNTITLTVAVSYATAVGTNAVTNSVSVSGANISAPRTANDPTTINAGPGYVLMTAVSPSGAGTVTPNPTNSTGLAAGHYIPGAVVPLTANANAGYVFQSWNSNPDLMSTTTNPTSITMNLAAESVTANFVPTTDFLTGFALNSPPLRNNYTGFVGLALTVGSNPLNVYQVGRVCVTGNTQSHLVKFVSASNGGQDVVNGSATVNMNGCTPGQTVYQNLASPIKLAAGGLYYLVSQETSGQDRWYDYGSVSTHADAAVTSAVWLNGTAWTPNGAANFAYVPADFSYLVQTPGGSNNFVSSYNLNQAAIRNNFSGYVGMQLTVGAQALNVTQVGRVCAGPSTQMHIVKFVLAGTGVDVPNGSGTVNMNGCTPGQFVYGTLASPVSLQANTAYYVVSQEFASGDPWYDDGNLTHAPDAAVNNAIWLNGGAWTAAGPANSSFVPPDFMYSLVGTPPGVVTVNVGANISGPSFTVDGTQYSSPQVFTWAPGSMHSISTTSPQAINGSSRYYFNGWSDSGSLSRMVSPSSNITYTANFSLQYLLTTSVAPSGGGTISPAPPSPTMDGYYNNGTPVSLTANANGGYTFFNWTGDLSGATNPQSVTMSAAHTVTANFQASAVTGAFLTGFALNHPPLRNNFGSFVGMELTVGSSALQVTSVGRVCVAANNGSHVVKFVNATSGTDVTNGSATVNMTGCTPGQFVYQSLAMPITLQAGASYYLVSQETVNGDQWYDYGTLTHTADATVNSSVWLNGTAWTLAATANTSYVPPDFLYSVVGAPPPGMVTVNVGTNIAGPTFTVDTVQYSSPQVFTWTAGSPHTISTTTPQAISGNSRYYFNGWNSSNTPATTSIMVSPGSNTTYTANFSLQYLLTTNVAPSATGSVNPTPASATMDGYYNTGTPVSLMATANGGYAFFNWTGDLSGTTNPQSITMSAAHTVTANFQVSAAPSGFLTGFALNHPPLRNNYGNFVGMKLTVGAAPLQVATVGRLCVTGNTGSHVVKFVSVDNGGTDVPNGSATVNMASCTPGHFVYQSLASPITLQPGSSYYLASQESVGGDQWYDQGAVSSTSAASIASAVYFDGMHWNLVTGVNSSYVPPDFQYTTLSSPSQLPYVTDYNLNAASLRNDFSGYVGLELTVGTSPMTVTELGRVCVAGNTHTHTLELVNASTNVVVASASLNTSTACTGLTGQFAYVALSPSAVLPANSSYYLVSQETAGGDQWYNFGAVTTASVAADINPAYSYDGVNFTATGGANTSYVPVNLEYLTTAPSISGVSSTAANGSYGVSAVIPIVVTFSSPVSVTGSPTLALNSGGTASYSSGSGTSSLTFSYTVAAGQNSSHLDYTSTSALSLNGGTISTGSVQANLTLPAPAASGSLSANKNLVVDTTAPTVVSYSVVFGVNNLTYNLIAGPRTTNLPWKVTGITVVFSKPIATGDQSSLGGITATGISGLGTNTLTWTFSAITDASLSTTLAATGVHALKDSAGNALAGGAGFSQSFSVLYGDFNGNGTVDSGDASAVGAAETQPYNIFADINGDGVVNDTDVNIVDANFT